MAYSQFNYKRVRQELNVHNQQTVLFPTLESIEPSEWLEKTLHKTQYFALFSEKARSEAIVFPILTEITEKNNYKISLYSGAILNADETRGLNGECDFILGSGLQDFEIETPLFCMIEAEDNDIEKNIPQCIAQMEGARIYNEKDGKPTPIMYGAVTTGTEWQFLKLENNICWIDLTRYYINDLPALLGALQAVINIQTKNTSLPFGIGAKDKN